MCDNPMVLNDRTYPGLQSTAHFPAGRRGGNDPAEIGLPILCRSEEELRFGQALSRLTPEQRTLLHRHCIEGETFAQIAAEQRRAPESVQQTFCLLRRQLQRLLMQAGLGPQDAMDCLYRSLTRHP